MRVFKLGLLYLIDYGLYWKSIHAICEDKRDPDWLAAAVTAVLVVLSCINACMGGRYLFSNGMALISAVLLGVCSTRYYCEKKRHAIALSAAFFSALYLIDFAGVLVIGILLQNPSVSDVLLVESGWQRDVYYGLLRGAEILLCRKLTKEKHTVIYDVISKKTKTLYLLAAALFWAMSQLLVVRIVGATVELLKDASVWVILAIALSVIFVIYQLYLNLKIQKKEEALKMQLVMENFQRLEVEQTSRDKVIHEVKQHIHAVQYMLEEKRYDEANRYLAELMGQIRNESVERWCDNAVVNAILNVKVAEAARQGIRVETNINVFPCKIDEMSLCIVISNLMENAIEAAVQTEKPWIEVVINEEWDRTKICIRNSYAAEPIEKKGVLQTTKKKKEGHGLGVQNAKAIAEQNHGYFGYAYKEGIFEAVFAV